MMAAATSVGAASGIRSWLAQKRGERLVPKRLHHITIGLFAIAVLVSGALSGSS
jgi:hypothetical protein